MNEFIDYIYILLNNVILSGSLSSVRWTQLSSRNSKSEVSKSHDLKCNSIKFDRNINLQQILPVNVTNICIKCFSFHNDRKKDFVSKINFFYLVPLNAASFVRKESGEVDRFYQRILANKPRMEGTKQCSQIRYIGNTRTQSNSRKRAEIYV
ncbi:hypothetical protein PUN28_017430 [Cardiocondyla obscurior]|uniref:Uncharacterized protein n=1 Tax=Cardiocondyla obscurior TaxID=286306 RepID=A0AAW2ERK6_9HYME